MNWIKLEETRILCLETGIEIILNRDSKKYWTIYHTGYQGHILTLGSDNEEAKIKFNEFISKLITI